MTAVTDDNADSADSRAEEAARGELYGTLSALFYAAPEPTLLDALRSLTLPPGDCAGGELAAAWQELADFSRAMQAVEIAAEYDTLFGGVGKPEVYLFGSHYLAGFLNEKPLAHLREDLMHLGIARLEQVSETEDHFSCLCAVMHHLIGEVAGSADGLQRQRLIFERHIASWSDPMCNAIAEHPKARFYKAAARLARAFTTIERQAFEMLEAEGGRA